MLGIIRAFPQMESKQYYCPRKVCENFTQLMIHSQCCKRIVLLERDYLHQWIDDYQGIRKVFKLLSYESAGFLRPSYRCAKSFGVGVALGAIPKKKSYIGNIKRAYREPLR